MNVVIVHCHFERGGVTQVVRNHVQAILQRDPTTRVTLLSGSRISDLDDDFLRHVQHRIVDGLDYDDRVAPAGWTDTSVDALSGNVLTALNSSGCSSADTVIHWHNHSLGKNAVTPQIIRRLAGIGWRFLLQIHDFAEDYRPENLKRLLDHSGASTAAQLDCFLYPTAPAIHYATLTTGDQRVLQDVGVEADRRHTLPNAVVLHNDGRNVPDQDCRESSLRRVRRAFRLPDDARWSVYPVRGIRRKNVGELLLLSQLMPSDVHTGITLCPTTEIERQSYRRWQAMAKRFAPRVVFDAGHHSDVSFDDNLNASEFVVSTSVAEGFGMVFLEPWLAGRGVVARRIASATDDFVAAGMQLDRQYDAIWIPGDSAWLNEVAEEFKQARDRAFMGLPDEWAEASGPATDGLVVDDAIDFAKLTPRRQADVLHRCRDDGGFMAEIESRATAIRDSFREFASQTIADNQACIAQSFSLDKQGRDLCEIYQTLADQKPNEAEAPSNAGSALATVLAVHPYFPCRTESLE